MQQTRKDKRQKDRHARGVVFLCGSHDTVLQKAMNHEIPSLAPEFTDTAALQPWIQKDWFEFDDSYVSPVKDPSSVVSSSGYVLFYRRQD